jgi:hypothetical protein
MYEKYNKLTKAQQKQLLLDIDKEYKKATAEIKAEIVSIVESKGKTQREKIKALEVILIALWGYVGIRTLIHSEKLIATTYSYFIYASKQLGNPLIMPSKEISDLIGKTIKKRTQLIKWNRVIQSNTKRLDRAVSNIVKKGLAESKTARQIQAELEKTMNMNRGKAKTIARTESNYYKSASKYDVGKRNEKIGNLIIKTWVYTGLSMEPRPAHKAANNDTVTGIDTYFQIGDFKTKAPGLFGVASQDINCTCDYKMEFEKDVDMRGYE